MQHYTKKQEAVIADIRDTLDRCDTLALRVKYVYPPTGASYQLQIDQGLNSPTARFTRNKTGSQEGLIETIAEMLQTDAEQVAWAVLARTWISKDVFVIGFNVEILLGPVSPRG